MKRLADVAEFAKLSLTDAEADPERPEEGLKALRCRIKQRLYKNCLCEVKGVGVIENLGKSAKAESQKKGKVSIICHMCGIPAFSLFVTYAVYHHSAFQLMGRRLYVHVYKCVCKRLKTESGM
jgi:hypothetical protein